MTWGFDSMSSVKFNLTETFLLGSCASDRHMVLYDERYETSYSSGKGHLRYEKKYKLLEPYGSFRFSAANEDYNLHTCDTRALATPVTMHMDHVSVVLGVDYSPTGKEFVSAHFDKPIQIFHVDKVEAGKYITQKECNMLSV